MANPVAWVINKIKKLNDYIWHTPLSVLSKRKLLFIKQLRIVVLAARGFSNDKVQLRASALTFYSLLSVIPVAAIAFAIAKGFGFDQNLEQLITDKFQAHQEVLNWLLSNARNALQETRGGYIAGVGMIILFWSVMSLLDHIESSFNHIWQISNSRPWYRKFTDYLTIMLIAPVFLILSSSVTVFVNTTLSEYMSEAPILDFFKPIITFLVQFAPYFLSWLTLSVLFLIMPYTKVRIRSAVVAGIIAGTILQVLQWLYIDLQFGITKLSSIYGSFAAIPLFIIWLQSSWIVVLLGAEISFANQNVSRYEFESEALNVSNYQKRALTIIIMHLVIRNFAMGEKPLNSEAISEKLKIPVRLVRDIIQDLNSVNLVSMVHEGEDNQRYYQPAMDINSITVSLLLSRLDIKGSNQAIVIKNREYEKVTAMLTKFDKIISKSDSNILIKDM
ncbi:MAG: YihY/virulence factor BrkB family protein [Odoribacter sp.]|nr:YihY/virulence factor BrkB family protein [Odoribacter sp.]